MDAALDYLLVLGIAGAFLFAVYRVMLWMIPDDFLDVFGPDDEPKP